VDESLLAGLELEFATQMWARRQKPRQTSIADPKQNLPIGRWRNGEPSFQIFPFALRVC
jgi:hypothetical protein